MVSCITCSLKKRKVWYYNFNNFTNTLQFHTVFLARWLKGIRILNLNAITILDFCFTVFTSIYCVIFISIYCVINFTYVLEFFWSIHRRILDNLSSLVHRRRLCSTWNRGSFQLQPRSPKLVLSCSYSMLFDRAERNWEN